VGGDHGCGEERSAGASRLTGDGNGGRDSGRGASNVEHSTWDVK
jgi:hypothetical protein